MPGGLSCSLSHREGLENYSRLGSGPHVPCYDVKISVDAEIGTTMIGSLDPGQRSKIHLVE